MKDAGVVFWPDSLADEAHVKHLGLKVQVAKKPSFELPWQRTMIVGPGVEVPWDLLAAGFHFVERWDAAAPLWRYGILAKDVGGKEERLRTRAMCLDLRVPLFEPALLFVRKSSDGLALMAAWHEELQHGSDGRLAFLRALHQVKPIFCALPRSWLAESRRPATARRGRAGKRAIRLSLVEVRPGQFVKCKPGDEERVKQEYAQMGANRHRRRAPAKKRR